MVIIINILLAAVPSLLLTFYFYRKDKLKKEPKRLIWTAFVLGFLAVIPAIIIEYTLSTLAVQYFHKAELLFRAFFIAGFVEEALKLAVVLLFLYPRKEFDEITDGIIYTVTAGLGFAFFENILYTTGPVWVLIIRGITAVPLHATASGIMGYSIGLRKFGKQSFSIFNGLLAAVLIHGAYDFLLMLGGPGALLTLPLLLMGWLVLQNLLSKSLKSAPDRGDDNHTIHL